MLRQQTKHAACGERYSVLGILNSRELFSILGPKYPEKQKKKNPKWLVYIRLWQQLSITVNQEKILNNAPPSERINLQIQKKCNFNKNIHHKNQIIEHELYNSNTTPVHASYAYG